MKWHLARGLGISEISTNRHLARGLCTSEISMKWHFARGLGNSTVRDVGTSHVRLLSHGQSMCISYSNSFYTVHGCFLSYFGPFFLTITHYDDWNDYSPFGIPHWAAVITVYVRTPVLSTQMRHFFYFSRIIRSRAMPQAVSRRFLAAETLIQLQASLCGICGGHISPATDFPPGTSVYSCQYHSTEILHTFIHQSLTGAI